MNRKPKPANADQFATNLAALPEIAVVEHVVDKSLVFVRRGEDGFVPTEGSGLTTEEIETFNERTGVTKAQAKAMLMGSMFGWDKPCADPATHEFDVFYDDIRAEFPDHPGIVKGLIEGFECYRKGGLSIEEAKERGFSMMAAARGERV